MSPSADSESIILEVCVDSVDGVLAAEAGGADRVELCANLLEGGTTPSIGTVELAVETSFLPVLAIVRPRGGDFLFSDAEFEASCRDVSALKRAGVAGVVIGVLDRDARVDRERTARLIDLARPLTVTFHRAFDMSRDAFESLETLVELGVDRILTSGQSPSVPEGLELIAELVAAAGDRIRILPGAGVREHNIAEVIRKTGAREVHFSAATVEASGMDYRNPRCSMGSGTPLDEYSTKRTDVERVRAFVRAVRPD